MTALRDLDLTRPATPDDLLRFPVDEIYEKYDIKDFVDELDSLWEAVIAELQDVNFVGRSHHNCGTYDAGCRGPLCRKAFREHPRRKKPAPEKSMPIRLERRFDPILEYYHTVAKLRIKAYKAELMSVIQAG